MSAVDSGAAAPKPRARWLRLILRVLGLLRPKRRWLQFSLRTLLLVMTLFALWLGIQVHRARQQKLAVTALMALPRASIAYHHEYDAAGNRIPQAQPPGPAWLRRMVGEEYFVSVRSVGLPGSTDADLAQLESLRELEELVVDGPRFTDDGLSHLEGLSRLKRLALLAPELTDAGLVHIAALCSLEELSLSQCRVSDVGLANLQKLNKLDTLHLQHTQVTAEGVERLKEKLPNLKVTPASFPSSPEERSAVARLIKFGALFGCDPAGRVKSVTFYGPDVTDAALVPLKELPALEGLNLQWTQVTARGVEELKVVFPKLVTTPKFFPAVPQEKEAVARLGMLGAELDSDEHGTIRNAALWAPEVTDAALADLQGLAHLKGVVLAAPEVTDAGLEHIRGLANLEWLSLQKGRFTDAGLAHLKDLASLKSLLVEGPGITDAGLVHLKALTTLEKLQLDGTGVTGLGLEHLKGLPNLGLLSLSGSQVTDATLVHITRLTHLKCLRLSRTTITDKGLVPLKQLVSLEELGLDSAEITDAGLVNLQGLENLRRLDLRRSAQLTDAGIARLKQALPDTRISH